jgi:hypothetical protein
MDNNDPRSGLQPGHFDGQFVDEEGSPADTGQGKGFVFMYHTASDRKRHK